ncbi:MAG: DUF1015 domain-containing protein [Bdellovibrionales bacterium]|nr:DUF1015 domain-containing protein [Bdellovibrionales bacterium]
MAVLKPLRGLRPKPELANKVASVPYDVVNTEEARNLAEGNALSFLRVVRSEIEFPDGTDPYGDEIYQRAKQNLDTLIKDGVLEFENSPSLYIYQLDMNGHIQTGVVGCCPVEEYNNNLIKKHEKTRPDKENDRTRHIKSIGAHAGPVFLTYKHQPQISSLVEQEIGALDPVYDFTAPDGVRHTVWKVAEAQALVNAFAEVPCTYVADGHHRIASAARCAAELKSENPNHTGSESYNYFLSVLFPDDELQILPYNRIIYSLGSLSASDVLVKLKENYEVAEGGNPVPDAKGHVSMFIDGKWFSLAPKANEAKITDPVESLEVSVLARKVLVPIFGIEDERTDKNVDFVGGIRGTKYLEQLVSSGKAACAFSLYPTSVAELMAVSDADMIMAPKSTWFEPKLRSGLIIHRFLNS